jgi:hypothetical protein
VESIFLSYIFGADRSGSGQDQVADLVLVICSIKDGKYELVIINLSRRTQLHAVSLA